MLSLGDLNNKKCKNKVWKINIQNFADLFSNKSIHSFTSGSNQMEKGRGLICDLFSRLTESDWKLLEKGLRGPYASSQILYHWKVYQWLNYSAVLWEVLPRRQAFTSHYLEKKKKGKRGTNSQGGESSFILTVGWLALKK